MLSRIRGRSRKFSQAVMNENLISKLGLSQSSQFLNKETLETKGYPEAFEISRNFEETTTSNGITVHSEYLTGGTSTISLFGKCGSRYENFETSGAAHFLEHLNFKGTQKRLKRDIEMGTENFGGNLNAYTTRDSTCFTITTLNKKLDMGMDLVADMICNSNYNEPDVIRERSVIHAEVQNCHLDYWNTMLETAHYACYKDSVMGLPILGIVDNINKITRDWIIDYHSSNYYGENIVISAAGGFDHSYLHQLVEETMGHLPKVSPTRATTDTALFTPCRMWIDQPNVEGNHYCILYEAPEYTSPDYMGFLILNSLISESDENAAFIASLGMEESTRVLGSRANLLKHGGSFKSTYLPYCDTGNISLYFTTEQDLDPSYVENLLRDYLCELAFNITEEDAERAKQTILMTILQMDSDFELSQEIGNQLVYFGKRISRQKWAKAITELATKENLQYLAMKYFCNKKSSFVVWGDKSKLGVKNSKYDRATLR